jgi:hypothetical protein
MLVMWVVSYILTVTGVFTSDPQDPGYWARTDAKLENVHRAKWFFLPYPGETLCIFSLVFI